MAPEETPDRPPFQSRLLAYIDILGWQAITTAGEQQKIWEAVTALELVNTAESKSRTQFREAGLNAGSSLIVSTFSDTIVCSCAPEPDDSAWLVLKAQSICTALLYTGHYARGALTFGELEHTDRLIAGRALVEAHKIEREVAKYPRVIISDAAEQFLIDAQTKVSPDLQVPAQVRRDYDSLAYLEMMPFLEDRARTERVQSVAQALKVRVLSDLAGTRQARPNHAEALNHRAKFGWMLSYLDTVLDDPMSILSRRPRT